MLRRGLRGNVLCAAAICNQMRPWRPPAGRVPLALGAEGVNRKLGVWTGHALAIYMVFANTAKWPAPASPSYWRRNPKRGLQNGDG